MRTDIHRTRRLGREMRDIDHHRQDTLMRRGRPRPSSVRSGPKRWWPYIGAVALVAAYVSFLPRAPAPPGASAMLISAPVSPTPD